MSCSHECQLTSDTRTLLPPAGSDHRDDRVLAGLRAAALHAAAGDLWAGGGHRGSGGHLPAAGRQGWREELMSAHACGARSWWGCGASTGRLMREHTAVDRRHPEAEAWKNEKDNLSHESCPACRARGRRSGCWRADRCVFYLDHILMFSRTLQIRPMSTRVCKVSGEQPRFVSVTRESAAYSRAGSVGHADNPREVLGREFLRQIVCDRSFAKAGAQVAAPMPTE